jgi:flagellar FliL protein
MMTKKSKQSGKSSVIVVCMALLLAFAGFSAAWWARSATNKSPSQTEHEQLLKKPPAYVVLEPMVVNLQPEKVEQFVRAVFSIQLANQDDIETFNQHLPQFRNQILLAIANKKSTEMATAEGKTALMAEIKESLNQAYKVYGKPGTIKGVYLTEFVIQY